jgi:hypothetical protein
MKTNVIVADRSIRMGLGLLLLASPILELRTYPYNLLGLVLIATAAFGFCPIYAAVSAVWPRRTPAPAPSRV